MPHHWAFEAARQQKLDLSKTIPLYSHGDEGRGKWRKAVLTWTMRGAVGQGTELFKSTHSDADQKARMGLNMTASLTTRFLHAVIPKSVYGKHAEPMWDSLAEHVGRAYRKLEVEGFEHCGQRFHAVFVGLTGDNPFLAKVGRMERSFSRAPKKLADTALHGVCWMCLAGTANVPYENTNVNAEWVHTFYETMPWIELPPFLSVFGLRDCHHPMYPQLFLFDVWRNFHGCVGKHMVSSTVGEILPHMEPPSLDWKFDMLNEAYQLWRQNPNRSFAAGTWIRSCLGLRVG